MLSPVVHALIEGVRVEIAKAPAAEVAVDNLDSASAAAARAGAAPETLTVDVAGRGPYVVSGLAAASDAIATCGDAVGGMARVSALVTGHRRWGMKRNV